MTNGSCWIHLSGIFAACKSYCFSSHIRNKSVLHVEIACRDIACFCDPQSLSSRVGEMSRRRFFQQRHDLRTEVDTKDAPASCNKFSRIYRVKQLWLRKGCRNDGGGKDGTLEKDATLQTPSLERKDKEKARKWHLPPTLSFNWTRRKLECISISQSKSFLMLILRKEPSSCNIFRTCHWIRNMSDKDVQ